VQVSFVKICDFFVLKENCYLIKKGVIQSERCNLLIKKIPWRTGL
jgi:hypothetical protein